MGIGHVDRATDAGPSNPDPIGNAEAHANAAPNTDANANAHAQAHASPYADTDPSPDANANPSPYANAGAHAGARSHIATERGGRCRGRDVAARRSAGGRLSSGGGDRPHAAGRQRGRFCGTF